MALSIGNAAGFESPTVKPEGGLEIIGKAMDNF